MTYFQLPNAVLGIRSSLSGKISIPEERLKEFFPSFNFQVFENSYYLGVI